MTKVEIDVSEVREFVAEMQEIPAQLTRHVRPVVEKGALNIKNQLQAEARQSRYFRIAPAITYDITSSAEGVEAEIGPDKSRIATAKLANIAYFGGAHGGGGTLPDPQLALDAEEPKFLKALEDLIGGVL